MEIMESHEWYDEDVHGAYDCIRPSTIEIAFRERVEAFVISKQDVVALAKEFGLVVYEKNSNL
jgi:hypothetical protein